jgi:hypothetical protein
MAQVFPRFFFTFRFGFAVIRNIDSVAKGVPRVCILAHEHIDAATERDGFAPDCFVAFPTGPVQFVYIHADNLTLLLC